MSRTPPPRELLPQIRRWQTRSPMQQSLASVRLAVDVLEDAYDAALHARITPEHAQYLIDLARALDAVRHARQTCKESL